MAPTRTCRSIRTSNSFTHLPPHHPTLSTPVNHSQPDSSIVAPLFPTSGANHPPRPSHHKKRPPSHIPRPPNAFILFRTNFIRERHLHTSTAGPLSNVSPTSLSTIAGLTWRNMPEEEREFWNEKARIARDEHRRRFPGYRYQPIPTPEERSQLRESKRKVKEENLTKPDLQRCQEISRLLCMGIKGEELENRIAQFDVERERSTHPQPSIPTRSSSMPSIPTPSSNRIPPQTQLTSTSRPRSFSTSDASYSASGAEFEYDTIPDTPELLPGDGSASQSYEILSSVTEHALPDLAYDSASPASINLPDPQETGYMPSANPYADFNNLSPHRSSHSLPQTSDHAMAQTQQAHNAPPQIYPTSFSTIGTWDHGVPTNPSAYNPFPYFVTNNNNDHVPTPANSNEQMSYNTMHNTSVGSTEAAHPYASSIPPFELHRKLKSFEQPHPYEFSELSQSFDAGIAYNLDPIY